MDKQAVFGQAKVVGGENELHASFMKTCSKCGFPGGVGENSEICIRCQNFQESKQMVSA